MPCGGNEPESFNLWLCSLKHQTSIRFYNTDLTLAPRRGHHNQTLHWGEKESSAQTQRRKENEKQQEKESRDLAVISCLCLEINHHSLYCTVLFQSHYAFTCVWNPDRLCSWSKSVIISFPHPLLLSALCHKLVGTSSRWFSLLNVAPSFFTFYLYLSTWLSTSTLIFHYPPTRLLVILPV